MLEPFLFLYFFEHHSIVSSHSIYMGSRSLLCLAIVALLLFSAYADEEDPIQTAYKSKVAAFEKWYKGSLTCSTLNYLPLFSLNRSLYHMMPSLSNDHNRI
jgi:hypothetical protein